MSYYNSPRWSQELLDCAIPLTLDTYSNCSFNCLYCFSQYQKGILAPLAYYLKSCKYVNIDKIKKMFLEPEKYGRQYKEYIKKKYAMQWGGLSDQFDHFEKKYKVTLELMKFFKEIKYPLSFSTKSTWVFDDDDYLKLLHNNKDWHIKMSIITLDDNDAKVIEQGVPTPQKRLDAISKIKRAGIAGVTLRLRPFLIGTTDKTYKDLIRQAKDKGVDSISVEFFCLESRASPLIKHKYKQMSKVLGYDLLDFYKKYSNGTGYMRLNYNIKRKYMDEMSNLCKKLNIKFHVSDAHHKEKGAHGCCCGVPENFNFYKGQMTEAIIQSKKGDNWYYEKLQDKFIFDDTIWSHAIKSSIHTRSARGNKSLSKYIRECWNNPKSGKSPYKYFEGVMKPVKVNDNGDVEYEYNER